MGKEEVEAKVISYQDWTNSWTSEYKQLFEEKLTETELSTLDVIVFINCVHLLFTQQQVAEGLGISIHQVRRKLTKVRKRFPELKCFDQNGPTATPKRFSKSHGDRGYTGSNFETGGCTEFKVELEEYLEHEKEDGGKGIIKRF